MIVLLSPALKMLSHLAMMLSSHAGDDVAEVTWPQCNVDVKSCWR
jgi:hypothetical protein